MKPIQNFTAEKAAAGTLPKGGYLATILHQEIKKYDWGEVLILSFDINDGEYKNFFTRQYEENTKEDKKWKGIFRLTVPDENSKFFEGNKRAFSNAIWAIEQSNEGYTWNWDEKTLEGKKVGVLFRNKEWEMNGDSGWTTECCALESIENIKSGNFRMPKDKSLKKSSDSGFFTDIKSIDNGDELPF